MTRKKALRRARKLFGPDVQVMHLPMMGVPTRNIRVRFPYRIYVLTREMYEHLGKGTTWREALHTAKRSEVGRRLRERWEGRGGDSAEASDSSDGSERNSGRSKGSEDGYPKRKRLKIQDDD